jgi:hypothetical protein
MMPTTPLGTWNDPDPAFGIEVLVRRTGVVASGQRDVQRLVERVLTGLAGLPADQVDDLVLAVEHQVVQPQQQGGPVLQGCSGPRLLGTAGAHERFLDVSLGGLRNHRQRLPGRRRVGGNPGAPRSDQPISQRGHVFRLERVGRPRVVLRVCRELGGGVNTHVRSVNPPVT